MEYLNYLDYLTQQYCGKEEEKCPKKSPTKTPRKNPPENKKRKIKKEKTEIFPSAHEKGGLVKNRKEKSSKSRRNKLLDKLRLVIPSTETSFIQLKKSVKIRLVITTKSIFRRTTATYTPKTSEKNVPS